MNVMEPAAIEGSSEPATPAVSGHDAPGSDQTRPTTSLPTLLGRIDVLAAPYDGEQVGPPEKHSQEPEPAGSTDARGCYDLGVDDPVVNGHY